MKQAKYTEQVSVLVTRTTLLRLEYMAADKKMSKSDLVRQILDGAATEGVEELPTRQVVTANIKYTLKEQHREQLARADESDAKAVNRERGILQKLLEALGGIKSELQRIHKVLEILPELKASLDEFLAVWVKVPRDDN